MDTRRLVRRAAVIAALLALPSIALGASTVKGKVTGATKLLNPVWNDAKDPNAHRYSFREPSPTVRPDVRNLTAYLPKELCIVALAAEKGTALKVPLRVVVSGGRTSPVTLVVAEGQQILFENQDPFPHKLYEVTGKGGLTPTEMAPTKTRTWTPSGTGKFEIRDQAAPSIRSWIVVEPRAAGVGYPDRKGEFSLDVEPGFYKLRAYFAGEPVGQELDANVPGRGDVQLRTPLVVGEPDKPEGKDKDKKGDGK